jgi:hypothetical protein
MDYIFVFLLGALAGIVGFYFFMTRDDPTFVGDLIAKLIRLFQPRLEDDLLSEKEIKRRHDIRQKQLLENAKFVNSGLESFIIVFDDITSAYEVQIQDCSRLAKLEALELCVSRLHRVAKAWEQPESSFVRISRWKAEQMQKIASGNKVPAEKEPSPR